MSLFRTDDYVCDCGCMYVCVCVRVCALKIENRNSKNNEKVFSLMQRISKGFGTVQSGKSIKVPLVSLQ